MKIHTIIFGLHWLTKLDLLRLLLVSVLGWLATPECAVARSWTGDGETNVVKLWSNPANWTPQGVPQNGEDLWFGGTLSPDLLMVNDLPNLTVRSLRFAMEDIGDVAGHLYGNTLGISQGIFNTNYFECQVYIHCGVRLTGNATFVTGNPDYNSFFGEDVTMHISGPIDLNGHNLVLFADSDFRDTGRMYIQGGILGVGNVLAIAGGLGGGATDYYESSLEFSGTGNDFTGALTLDSRLNSEILLNLSSGVVVNDLLILTNVGDVKLLRANQIGDAATVRLKDGATLQLNGYSDTILNLELITDSNDSRPAVLDTFHFSGGVLSAGTLSVAGNITSICNNGAQTPAIKGILNLLSGSHDINVSGSVYAGLDIQAQMMGVGNFSKSGAQALLLTASNSFNSTISILKGVLDVRNNHALGDIVGSTEIFEGNLTLRNVAIGAESLFALGGSEGEFPGAALTSIGISSWSGQVLLNTNLVVTGDMSFTGSISGTGGMGCFGGGTIRLGGLLANTYTGTTLVRCPLLELNKPFGISAYRGPLVVGGGLGGTAEARWLNFYQNPNNSPLTLYADGFVNLSTNVEDFGPVTFNGGLVQTTSGSFITYNSITANPAATTAVINGNLALSVSPALLIVSNGVAEPDLLINAVISGSAVRKQGQGTVIFTGQNTYTGNTVVEEGIMDAANNAALGSASAGTIVSNGATLRLSNFGTVPESLTLFGTGAGGNGVVHVTGNPTVTGGVFLSGPSTINVAPGGRLAIDSIISGTGPLTKTGPGNLHLGGISGGAGHNTYSGSTIVTAGTLYLSKNQNVTSVPGPLVIGPATVAAPATAFFSRAGTLVPAGTVTVNANSLLDLNNNNQTLAQLNLNDGGDVQTGTGTINFSAGGNVNVGTLNPPQTGLQASSLISGRIEAAANEYLIFNVGPYGVTPLVPDPELVVAAQIAGSLSSIVKNGPGGMRLSGNNTFAGIPNAVTEFDINAGTVFAASSTALGGADNWVFVYNDASLALINNITINNKPLYLNSTNPAALNNLGGDNTWTGPVILDRDSGIAVVQDWSLQTLGVISGTGSLTKRGAGLLRLGGSANNTYSGNTFVEAGDLYLTKVPNIQAVPANLIIGRPEGGSSATVMHVNSDLISGNVTVNNGGLLNLNGYTETIGNLTLNGGGDVQTGAGTLHLFTSLAVNPGSFANQSVISGRLGLYPGTLQFTVGPGSLGPDVADCLVSAIISQTSTTAGLQKSGAGVLQLTGTNTYAGGTTLYEGTLWVNGSQAQSAVQVAGSTLLKGTGTLGHLTVISRGPTIAPGSSPGVLTIGNFSAATDERGTLQIELNGTTPGSGHDQLNVRGTVNLTGFTLNLLPTYHAATNDQFVLINNDHTEAVIGTFTGLPQNATITAADQIFRVSYTGGTGNDVVLTKLSDVYRPVLTIEQVPPAAIRLLWATSAPPFSLQSNTNLNTANWASVSPPPVIVGTNNVVTNAISGAQRFYRLSNP